MAGEKVQVSGPTAWSLRSMSMGADPVSQDS